MAISHVTNEPNICQFQYIYSINNNVVVKRALVVVKHGYKMTIGVYKDFITAIPNKGLSII